MLVFRFLLEHWVRVPGVVTLSSGGEGRPSSRLCADFDRGFVIGHVEEVDDDVDTKREIDNRQDGFEFWGY